MKKVLIFFPDALFPTRMANQRRCLEVIKTLSPYCKIYLVCLVESFSEELEHHKNLDFLSEIHTIYRPTKYTFSGAILRIKWRLYNYLGIKPKDYMLTNGIWFSKQMTVILKREKYDVAIANYWTGSSWLKQCSYIPTRIIDTHNVLSFERKLQLGTTFKVLNKKYWIKRYIHLEKKNLSFATNLIAISKQEFKYYSQTYKNVLFIPMGIDMDPLQEKKYNGGDTTILFYGYLSSNQNILACKRLYNEIMPLIWKKTPSTKLLIVGGNPSKEIVNMGKNKKVTITGFVDEPQEYILKTRLMLLPLTVSSGFRGRIPEVMGLGVPVAGTHNALDCIGIENNINGFISDSNEEIASFAIKMLTDRNEHKRISNNSKLFISKNFSNQEIYKPLLKLIN